MTGNIWLNEHNERVSVVVGVKVGIPVSGLVQKINRLTPNDPYMGRTAPQTSKRCILYIYSTNIGTEYFKHALYSTFFSHQNAEVVNRYFLTDFFFPLNP